MYRKGEKPVLDLEGIRRGYNSQHVIREAKGKSLEDISSWPKVEAKIGEKVVIEDGDKNNLATVRGVRIDYKSPLETEGELLITIDKKEEGGEKVSLKELACSMFTSWNENYFQRIVTEADLLDAVREAGNLIDQINAKIDPISQTEEQLIWQVTRKINVDENLVASLILTTDGILDFSIT